MFLPNQQDERSELSKRMFVTKLFWTNYEDKRTVISHPLIHSVFVPWEWRRGGEGRNHSDLGC